MSSSRDGLIAAVTVATVAVVVMLTGDDGDTLAQDRARDEGGAHRRHHLR